MCMKKREYIETNKAWLKAKSQEAGIKPLPKGAYYKVKSQGRAVANLATPRSTDTGHYTGRTIDGQVFDSTEGDVPAAFRLSDLIEGWIIALQQMCIGDRWEVYLPAELAYGRYAQPGIPAGSTLIFELELVSIA